MQAYISPLCAERMRAEVSDRQKGSWHNTGAKRVNPTHMRFTRLKEKLATVIRGHKLLRDKRDEPACQFLDLVHENKTLRGKVEASIAATNQNFVLTRSGMTNEALNVALMAPGQEVHLETETRNIMNVEIPMFKYKTRTSGPNNVYSYSLVFTSSNLDDAVKSLTGLLSDVLRLAGCEKSRQLMAAETEKTRHRVDALERVMILDIQSNIRYITMKLDESERSSQTRLMKVKDMMLEETHHYSEREAVPVVDEM